MEYSVSPARLEDLPGLVDLFFEAYDSPEVHRIFPKNEGGRAYVCALYEASIRGPTAGQVWQDRKAMLIRDGDGRVLSSVIFFFVRAEDSGFWPWRKRYPVPTLEMGIDEALLDELFSMAEVKSAEHLGQLPHIYVGFGCTLIDQQRKGHMGKLLEAGHKMADELDWPMFLTSSEVGKPVYLKKGYELLEPDSGVSCPMMRKKKSERDKDRT
ncbi:hypothetical protein BX600DRAFT_545903 [Xylariales sp. PMI_506]|nr:hypothetical protein BX600DRAFT_545903 [Xylariales sp. PMI_506]